MNILWCIWNVNVAPALWPLKKGGQGDGQALLGGHDADVPPSDVTHQADGLLAGAQREVAASRGREVREEVGGAAISTLDLHCFWGEISHFLCKLEVTRGSNRE